MAEVIRFPVEKRVGSPAAKKIIAERMVASYIACLDLGSGMDCLPDVDHSPTFDTQFRTMIGAE